MSGFLIQHKSNHTGSIGQGEGAFANRAFAQKYAQILNKIHPEFDHSVIDAPPNTRFLNIKDYSLDTLNEEDVIRDYNKNKTRHLWSAERAYEDGSDDEKECQRRGWVDVTPR